MLREAGLTLREQKYQVGGRCVHPRRLEQQKPQRHQRYQGIDATLCESTRPAINKDLGMS